MVKNYVVLVLKKLYLDGPKMAPKWLKVPQKSIFSGLCPEPRQGFAPGTHWGGGGGLAAPLSQTPSCWLLATLVCNALRVLSILCLRYFPAFSFHESCIPDISTPFQPVLTILVRLEDGM